MKNVIAKLIEISFEEMNKKIKNYEEIVNRQNEILIAMDDKLVALEKKIQLLEKDSIETTYGTDVYKYGTKGGDSV